MGIRQITPRSAIRNYLAELTERRVAAVINQLQYVGEACIAEARTTRSYTDRTGNLRSSIGYVLIRDGKIITMSAFKEADKGTDRVTGTKDGEAFARQLVNEFPKGITLVITAGMKYASYVAAKGYNVIDSSEDLADRLVPQLLKDLGI